MTMRLLFATCLLLAGCATGPQYERPALALPTAWLAPAGDEADLVNRPWWGAFGDPQLDALIDAAILANQDLAVAAGRVEQFAARLRGSEAERQPRLVYGTGATRERRSEELPNGLRPGDGPTLSRFDLGASMSWELDLWGRVRLSVEGAQADLLASEEARRGVMLTVVADVAATYIHLLALDQRLALTREKMRLRGEALALTEARRSGGSATRLDVERMRAALEEQATALPALAREISAAELALNTLLGRMPGPVARRGLDDLTPIQVPAGLPADVLTRRPDVAAAEQQVVAAHARIGVARTGRFPSLSLSAAIGLGADDLRWLFAETARTASLGAALAGSLFDGGRIDANVREAEALRRQAEAAFIKTVQVALGEVEDQLTARLRADEREDAGARRLRTLQTVRDLVEARVQGGQITRHDLFDADLALQDARMAQAEFRRDRLLALVGVYKAMGGGWMADQERRRAAAGDEGPPEVAATMITSKQASQ